MPSWSLPFRQKAAAPAAPAGAAETPATDLAPDVGPQATDVEKPPVQPPATEAAPQRTVTTSERRKFRAQSSLRLLFGVLYWLIFMALNIFEIQNDYRMNWRLRKVNWNHQLYPVTRGQYGIRRERRFIWFTWGLHLATIIAFAVAACTFMMFRQVRAMRTLQPQGRSRGRWLVWAAVLLAIATDFMKLYALGSVINKLRYINQWCPGGSARHEFKYMLSSGGNKNSNPNCKPHHATNLIRWSIVFAVINTLFNTFIFFTKQPKGVLTKIMSAIPAVVLVVLLYIKPLSSMLLLHYAQRHYVSRGDMTYRSEAIVALIAQMLALLFSLQMAYVISDLHLFTVATNRLFRACGYKGYEHDSATKRIVSRGKRDTHLKDQYAAAPQGSTVAAEAPAAPPPPPSLRNTFKIIVAQWFYIGQLPIAFNLLAPILVMASLHIWNFWVGLDFILGLVFFILYLVCLVFHKMLFPQWQH